MVFGRFRFVPPWWGVLLVVIAWSVLGALGVWQIHRAHYKTRLLAQQQAAQRAGPTELAPARAASGGNADDAGIVAGREYTAAGHYDAAHQVLLTDQLRGVQAGYRVWTPLVLGTGVRIMVDRGWVPRPDARAAAPPDPSVPDGAVQVHGVWHAFPQPGFGGGRDVSCADRGWPRTLSYPDAAGVRCQYNAPVANGLLLLDPKAPGGFVRDWQASDSIGLRPYVHYLYAVQWFAMAAAAGVILVVVNLKRR